MASTTGKRIGKRKSMEAEMLAEFTKIELIGIWIILWGIPLLAGCLVALAHKDKKGRK